MPVPSSPDRDHVSCYLRKWENLENYQLQEESLRLLFRKLCPSNSELEQILLKVSSLNDFYSTNIYDTHTVARHIRDMNIGTRLKSGDLSLVNDMAMVKIGDKTRNLSSFASKYCSHHYPDRYPIYDSYVDKMLWHYSGADKFASFRRRELKHYEKFVEIIAKFQRYYKLDQFSLRQIDIFLWRAGKESFPNSYPSGKNGTKSNVTN